MQPGHFHYNFTSPISYLLQFSSALIFSKVKKTKLKTKAETSWGKKKTKQPKKKIRTAS